MARGRRVVGHGDEARVRTSTCDYLVRDFQCDIGAEIRGRNKFGPLRGPWADHGWQGWWGEEPPFHTPVFVMTHYERPSFTFSDTLHVAVCDVVLGGGSRLWAAPDELFDRFHCDVVPSPSGVVHHLFWRR